MKESLKNISGVRFLLRMGYYAFVELFDFFPGSKEYWKKRYDLGGTSGAGSYNQLAEFKANILNRFVEKEGVKSVLEFGCGDGNQVSLFNFPSYTGFDISEEAISRCKKIFAYDKTKKFRLMKKYDGERAQLTLSLDVIYHLVEDDVYQEYMQRLFDSSTQYVIIYSSNTDEQSKVQMNHIKHRKFADWIERNRSNWKEIKHISADDTFADFYIYEKQ